MIKPFVVFNEDQNNFTITYYVNDQKKQQYLHSLWKSFNSYDPALAQTVKILCRPTNPNMEVTVEHYLPSVAPAGRYRVETFVPSKHSNSRKAIFTVTNNIKDENGTKNEEYAMVVVDLSELHDIWYSLGEYYFDPAIGREIGRVRQYDLSLEDPPMESSYGPVRWIPLFGQGKFHRFDAPVGSKQERDAPFPTGRFIYGRYPIWVGNWFDANPFLSWYIYGYHTGADLNLPGSSAADMGKEVYAIGDGKVTYAGRAGTWGNIIVIAHPEAKVTLPNGTTRKQAVYSRYGHVDNRIMVKTGQEVQRGQLLGFIGLAANAVSGWHLHFDICYTDLLSKRPAHWPNLDMIRAIQYSNPERDSRPHSSAQLNIMKEVINNYVDPLKFIRDNHG
ncbi:MAG: M23 family metallopeptidase [Anaerolineales bacterium]